MLFDRPLVIWAGTWKFSVEDVAAVAGPRRRSLLILASERNVDGYQRLAGQVGGDAYYWSSVNPDTFKGYDDKLAAMGRAVHAQGGLWLAPVAPGFDARLVGGTSTVERRGDQTLRRQMNAALQSSPDAIGLISWNEFSENTYIEPSRNFGSQYLAAVSRLRGGLPQAGPDFDSSEPAGVSLPALRDRLLILGGLVVLIVVAAGVVVRRR